MKKIAMYIAMTSLISAAGLANAQGGRPLTANLTGAAEVPVTGDPDGSGAATVRVNVGQGTLCYTVTVTNIETATAAHIHEAPAGSAGGVAAHLNAPTDGMSSGCTTLSKQEAKDIIKNPQDYYVNVHNATYPGGALRGQLSK